MDEQEEQPAAGQLPAPPQVAIERSLDQKVVPFMGDDLVAAMTTQGDIYISLPGMCAALGLDARGQLQRLRRTEVLARGLGRIPLNTVRGRQVTYCLRLDKLGLWLAGIETTRIKPEFRAKIIAYQEELAPVAMRVFLRVAGLSTVDTVPAGDPRVTALAEQYDAVMDVARFLREHLDAILATTEQVSGLALRLDQAVQLLESLAEQQQTLAAQQQALTADQQALAAQQANAETRLARVDARTQHLTPAHQRQVQTFVERMVRETQQQPGPLTYAIIYGRLKSRFQVGTYSEVPDEKFDELMAYLVAELRRATEGQAPEQGRMF